VDHVVNLAVTASMSFSKAPVPTVDSLRMYEEKPHLFDKDKKTISAAQSEAVMAIISVFKRQMKNSVHEGFWLGRNCYVNC